ncbi:unnamed protein product [Eruca vesicaria subsp. sativa]|uniref:Uncharacterized protein n=1 Tax=Eruca vesicaria subsp. sativa TaxID=29727 RepID=A0ABC8KIP5_ERUVS|nr:unnamed protein product [Eruca vesicaria subsp. sativa]
MLSDVVSLRTRRHGDTCKAESVLGGKTYGWKKRSVSFQLSLLDDEVEKTIHGRTLAIRSAEFAARGGLPVLKKASLPSKGSTFLLGQGLLMISAYPQLASAASEMVKPEPAYEVGELFDLSIQLSYLLLLLGLLGVGTFYVICQVLVRRELDLSAKELQEQVRSGDASATELFEFGSVMLRRKFYPAANKFLLQAIQKWDGDDQDLAQDNTMEYMLTKDTKFINNEIIIHNGIVAGRTHLQVPVKESDKNVLLLIDKNP